MRVDVASLEFLWNRNFQIASARSSRRCTFTFQFPLFPFPFIIFDCNFFHFGSETQFFNRNILIDFKILKAKMFKFQQNYF